MPKTTLQQIQNLLREYQLDHEGHISIEALGKRSARVRFRVGKKHLRPGDTVSGPTLMALADVAMYAALLGEIGQRLRTLDRGPPGRHPVRALRAYRGQQQLCTL